MDTAEGRSSPLVLDIDGDGVELTSIHSTGSVYWDYDGDGFAEAGGWVTGGDGLLCIDVNSDGIINNSLELFSDQTGYNNGFLVLASYDSNADGLINSSDVTWGNLKVWIDTDGDSFSDAGELHTMGDLLITSINLSYSDVSYTISGNQVLQESTFIINGNTRDIVDAWFSYNNSNTVHDQPYTLDARTFFLPLLRGYGTLPNLHISESLDNTATGNLLSVVDSLNDKTFSQLFDATSTVPDLVKSILFRWAGVDGVSATSRGAFVDGRELGFLEKLVGEPFLQRGTYSNPYGNEAGYDLQEAFRIAFNNAGETKTGGALDDNFNGHYGNDTLSGAQGNDKLTGEGDNDTLTGGLGDDWLLGGAGDDTYKYSIGDGEDRIDESGNTINADTIQFQSGITLAQLTLTRMGNDDLVIDVAGGGRIIVTDQFEGYGRVETLGFADGGAAWTILAHGYETWGTGGNDAIDGVFSGNGGAQDDVIRGGAGNDTITDNYGDDLLDGGAGNDALSGGYDDDTLIGGDGDDDLDGGAGLNTFIGGEGDDTTTGASGDTVYYYTSGHDRYDEASGTDVVYLDSRWNDWSGSGIQVPHYQLINGALQIWFDERNDFKVLQWNTSYENIETMVFANGPSVTLTTVTKIGAIASSYGQCYTRNGMLWYILLQPEGIKCFCHCCTPNRSRLALHCFSHI